MNTKKNKNKKQNKPNPSIPPKAETQANVSGNTEVTEQKSVDTPEITLKSDERVPEIISGPATPSVGEIKDPDGDTPKKPKRNRGKKKKSDKGDDFDDEKESETTDKVIEKKNKTVEVKSGPTSEINKRTASGATAPDPQNKKNKKDEKQGDEMDTFVVSADHPLKVTHLTASEAENVMSDVKMITCIPVATEGTEQDGKKKKNKKKKRTDSEKSEKEELVCTAAFQKIMEPRDDKKDKKQIEGKTEDNPKLKEEVEPMMAKLENTETEKVSLDMILKENLKSTEPEQHKAEDTSNPLYKEADNKNKKKNKKEKKHLKPESGDESSKTPEPIIEEVTDMTPTEITPSLNLTKVENQPRVAIDCKPDIKEEVSKLEESRGPPKAKFSKPVEKKNKETKDLKPSETLSEAALKEEEPIVKEKPLCTDKKLVAKEISEQKPEKISTEIADRTIAYIMEETDDKNQKDQKKKQENIQIPDQGTAKKSKKSPKPQKHIEDLKSEEKTVDKLIDTKMELKIDPKQETIEVPSLMPITEVEELQKESSEKNPAEDTIRTEHSKSLPKIKPIPESTLAKEIETKQSKAIPLPFPTTEILSSTEHKKTLEPKSVLEPEKGQDVAKGKACKTEILQHIPSPDGGMGKKRGKSPKSKRDVGLESTKPEKDIPITIKSETEVSETIKLAIELSKTEKVEDKPQLIPANLSLFQGEASIKEDKETCGQIGSKKCDNSKKTEKGVLKPDGTSKTEPVMKDTTSDVEVCGVKTEASSPLYDIAPLVDHPRSSSQSADGNNNLFIREIDTEENMPSAIVTRKLETPIIQSTAQIPFLEAISIVRPKKEEKNQMKAIGEKTDLKSKMMEVNQDMEGLRKSIEKSLAELSSIEKSEKGTEKQFIDAQSKLEQIKDIALKQHANIKQNIAGCIQEQSTTKNAGKEMFSTKTEFQDRVELPTAKENIELLAPQKVEIVESKKHEEGRQALEPCKTPEPPARKDNKGKGKSKKKVKQETEQSGSQTISTAATAKTTTTPGDTKDTKSQENKSEDKPQQKTEKTQQKAKQQTSTSNVDADIKTENSSMNESKTGSEQFEPIENFEDALASSVDDVNKTFEIIANDAKEIQSNPEINITAPKEEQDERDKEKKDKQAKVNPVSQPKNLLGHPEIPARSNKMDYKKEKNKTPNSQQAKVKLKDVSSIEKAKISKDTQTENKKLIKEKEVISSSLKDNEEYIYKYSFRRVFLPNACHVCKIELKKDRVQCNFCNLVFYCSLKHKDQDSVQHEAFCFAVSTIIRLKDQKHIYQNTANITGHDYRLLRMQMIVSCEKILKRRLEPCEQEMLLYPRVCADPACREWRQEILKDCEGCGQISYCTTHHPPISHQKWCKSYSLYHKLVSYQQLKGRLEPKLPTKVMSGVYKIPGDINEVLAAMYEEKIDMSDIQYAALTQVATAPLTAAYCYQLYSQQMNVNANGLHKKSTFTIHVVGAELQFEADALNKWEVFFLHLRPDVSELRIVLIGPDLNPGNLPLDLLAKIRLCENCNVNKRRVIFDFQDKKHYNEYWSTDFITPDLVCTFNPSIQRSSILNGKDTWPSTIRCIFKQKTPFIITSYTINELHRDLARIKEFSKDFNVVSEPKFNSFASVRPDRNFISDDEMPLLFKNYCFLVVCGAF